MPAIKFQVFRGNDNGSVNCDYRGTKFIGNLDDPRNVSQIFDAHRTIPQLELDPANESIVNEVLTLGPAINALLARFTSIQPEQFSKVADALGLEGEGDVGLRVGVWDE